MNKPIGARIAEFVDYHIRGDGECNNVILKAWADRRELSTCQRDELAYLFSVTYCVLSAIYLYEAQDNIKTDVAHWVTEHKSKIIFQSDRKYMKMQDCFLRCLKQYFRTIRGKTEERLAQWSTGQKLNTEKAIKDAETWDMFGRFSAFLYLETLTCLIKSDCTRSSIKWEKGDTATSGLLNVFGYDNSAIYFDKENKLPPNVTPAQLDAMLKYIQDAIKAKGGDDNTVAVETSLCAYRKFYKGTRYNGYYLDRMLEEINWYQTIMPETCAEVLKIRREAYDKKYLGELNGWQGIRKEMKKYYIENGVIN